VEWRNDDWLYLVGDGNSPADEVAAPQLPPHPWPETPPRIPFNSIHYATPRLPSSRVIREPEKLTLHGSESLESCFEQALLARRLTTQRAVAKTKLRFKPQSFQQMAGLVVYYNNHLFHYLYLTCDEEVGTCLQIHSCDDGVSSFPLAEQPVRVTEDELFFKVEIDHCQLRFFWSNDDQTYTPVGRELDASILSDDHGKHWGFTGSFIGLACQDLTGDRRPAEFDFLEITDSSTD
jgi:xylan 1,4-beta-xylosidase